MKSKSKEQYWSCSKHKSAGNTESGCFYCRMEKEILKKLGQDAGIYVCHICGRRFASKNAIDAMPTCDNIECVYQVLLDEEEK